MPSTSFFLKKWNLPFYVSRQQLLFSPVVSCHREGVRAMTHWVFNDRKQSSHLLSFYQTYVNLLSIMLVKEVKVDWCCVTENRGSRGSSRGNKYQCGLIVLPAPTAYVLILFWCVLSLVFLLWITDCFVACLLFWVNGFWTSAFINACF